MFTESNCKLYSEKGEGIQSVNNGSGFYSGPSTSSNVSAPHSSLSMASQLKTEEEASGIMMDEDIKPPPEIQLNSFPIQDDPKDNGSYLRGSCSLENNSDASSLGGFLAKRPLGHTYLDLDSRCIAL